MFRRVATVQWRGYANVWLADLTVVCTRVCLCARARATRGFLCSCKKPEALHNEWRGGSAAMQTALTRAEHEKALIALIQLSALKRNVTHAERGRSRGKSNAFSVSFIYQEAHISQITVRSGTCEPLCPQAPPGILSSGRERRGKKRCSCSSWIAPSCEECTTCLYRMLIKYLWFQEATRPNYPCKN